MFFIGIFGVQQKEKEVSIIENLECKSCSFSGDAHLIKSYSYFHVFFLPIFKWNYKYYVLFDRCNHIYEISKEKGKRVEAGEKNVITYWDFRDDCNNYRKIYCPQCSREVETTFEYCPYCGNKLK